MSNHPLENIFTIPVLFDRGRKGKKGQQQQRKGKESPTESPTSPNNGFSFDNATRVTLRDRGSIYQ